MNRTPCLLTVLLCLVLSACGGGGGGGASDSTVDNKNRTTPPVPVPRFSCRQGLDATSEDKNLICDDDTNVSYLASNHSLCRMDTLDGISVSTCFSAGQTSPVQMCTRENEQVGCPEVSFSCEISRFATADTWILSCDDETAMSMDMSNSEMCRINLTDSSGFCLDDNNDLSELATVWTGYARNIVGIGEDVILYPPLWGSSGTTLSYSATPAGICSVDSETGILSMEGFGDCHISLIVSANSESKVIAKTVRGRLAQNTAWSGYTANSMDFGTTPPTLIAPQYAQEGVGYTYSVESPDVCSVDAATGEIAPPVEAGDCIVILTASAANYADRRISFTLRVDPLSLPALSWTDPYGAGPFDVTTTLRRPNSGALAGQGGLRVVLKHYRSTTPTVCSVDEVTGIPTLLLVGDCTIETSATLPGYRSETFSTTLGVSLATMSLSWTSPISSLGNTDSVLPNEPSGIPGSAAVSGLTYSSQTPQVCSVDGDTGEITGIAEGTCTARLTVTFPGYREGIVDLNIRIALHQDTVWRGYSASETPFGTTPTLNPPGRAPGGTTFTYSSLTQNVCTVHERTGALTLVDHGDCRIRMISSVPGRTHGDKLFEFDLSVLPVDLPELGVDTLYGNGPFHVESTGLAPVSDNLDNVPDSADITLGDFASLTLDICTIDEQGNVALLRDGICNLSVTVSAAGYTDKVVSVGLEVGLAQMNLTWDGYEDSDDTIMFGEIPPALEAPVLTTATTHSFSYASGDPNICTVDEEGALTILRDGACEITLTASALGYETATAVSSQTINLGTITGVIWSDYSPSSVGVGRTRRATAPTGVPEGASVSYGVDEDDGLICSVDAVGTITGLTEGDCEVTLTTNLLGYEDLTLTNTINIGAAQTIEWNGYDAQTVTFPNAPTLVAPTDIDDATVSYVSGTESVCSVDGTTGELTILDQGLCTIRLTSVKENYATKMISFDLTIDPGVMTDFAWKGYDADTVVFPNGPNLEEPTGMPGTATLTYASQTEEVCTVNETDGELTLVDIGVCTVNVTASAAGYTSRSLDASIIISIGAMNFTWTGYSESSVAFGAPLPTLNVPTDVPVGASSRYLATPLSVCLVDANDGTLTVSGEGVCTIVVTASAPGYVDGSHSFDLTVTRGTMSSLAWAGYSTDVIDFGDTPPALILPEGVPWGATLNYVSSAPNICAVDPGLGTLSILNSGSCTMTLTVSATNYTTATYDFAITVNAFSMDSLAWSGYSPDSVVFGEEVPTYNPPEGEPNNTTFNHTSSDENICTVDSTTGELTLVNHGTCTINMAASSPGYNDSNLTATVTIAEGTISGVEWNGYDAQTVTFPNAPAFIDPNGIPVGASTNYAVNDENVCTVDDQTGVLTLIDQGTCTITLTISQVGYADLTKTFQLTINPLEMTDLAWTGYPSSILVKGPFVYPNDFTGVPSGVSYRYSTTTPDICLVEKDGDLWGRGIGTCTVTVTAHALGYNDRTEIRDVAVVRGGVAVGSHRSCLLLPDGQIKCWGGGNVGGLGTGNTDHVGDQADEMGVHLASVDLGTNFKVKFMATSNNNHSDGHTHTCAISDRGLVKCWGGNNFGQLGQGHTGNIGDSSGEMGDDLPYTTLGGLRTAGTLALGEGFSCALLDDNGVKCWGQNDQGQLGQNHRDRRGDDANEMGDRLPYVHLGTGRSAKDISLGVNHACALLDNNKVKCWGGNENGQLGQGGIDDVGGASNSMENLGAIDLGTNRSAKKIGAGGYHTCAILDDNNLVCWGANANSKLGIDYDANNPNIGDASGEMGDSLLTTHLVSQDAVYVDLGSDSTCVIKKNQTFSCWGGNTYGELGLEGIASKGSTADQAADVEVNLGSNRQAKIAQIGYGHACALLDDDSTKCWGRNNLGQLGQGNTTTVGDGSGEMGDNLLAVNLVPDMIDLNWAGYTPDTPVFGGDVPALNAPMGAPSGAIFAYSTTSSVCSVDSNGALTIVDRGVCTVQLTASAAGYRNRTKTFDLMVDGLSMDTLAWGGYSSSGSVPYGTTGLSPTPPTGALPGAVLRYASATTSICTVDEVSGALTTLARGFCTVTLRGSLTGYNDRIIARTILVNPGAIDLVWTGYSSNRITFDDPLTLSGPTVNPSNANLKYTSRTLDVCTVDRSNGAVTYTDDGICTIRLTASSDNYNDATVEHNITIDKKAMSSLSWAGYDNNNTATFPTSPTLVPPLGAPSGAIFEYVSLTKIVCLVNLNTGALTLVGSGMCDVQVTARADGYESSSRQVQVTVNPGVIDLAWTGYSSSNINFGDSLTLNTPVVTPGDAVLRYASSTLSFCAVNSFTGAVTQINNGVCTITLTASKPSYTDSSVPFNITIVGGTMTNVAWEGYEDNNTAYLSADPPRLIFLTGVPLGAIITFRSQTTNICTVDSRTGILTVAAVGSCIVQATAQLSGYDNWSDTVTVTVNSQRVGFAWTGYSSNTVTFGDSPLPTPNAPTGAPSGTTFAYSTTTTDVCTVTSAGVLTIVDKGACVVTVTGSLANYSDRSLDRTITVNGLSMNFSWTGYSANSMTFGESPPSLAAPTGARAGVSFSYSTEDETICTVNSSGVLTIVDDGACVVTATASLIGYEDAHVEATVTVRPLTMSLTWAGYTPGTIRLGDTLTLSPPTTNPGGATFRYTSDTENVCSVDHSSGAVTQELSSGSGTCTIRLTASKAGYRDMVETFDIAIFEGPIRTLAWTGYSPGAITFSDDAPTLNPPTGYPSNATLTYSSRTTSICTVDPTTGALTILNTGRCNLSLSVVADGYEDTRLDRSVYVNTIAITVNWTGYSPDTINYGDNPPSLNTPSLSVPEGRESPSIRLVYTVSSRLGHICRIDNNITGALIIVGVGTCTVALESSGLKGYAFPNNTRRNVTINEGTMNLAWTGYSSSTVNYGDNAPSLNTPTGAPRGATFAYSTTTTDVCTVDAGTGALTIEGVGICRVAVTATATNYNDASTEIALTVNAQTINLVWTGYSANSIDYADKSTPPTLSPPTGYPINTNLSYSSSTERICSVDGTTGALTILATGICTVTLTASLTGYNEEVRTFDLTVSGLNIGGSFAWSGYSSSMVLAGPIIHPNSVTGTLPAGGSYAYSTSTPGICSVDPDDGGVWALDLGTCDVTVTVQGPGYNDKVLPEVSIIAERRGVGIGPSFSCVLLSSGRVRCWGGNSHGQLGRGNTDHIGDGPNEIGSNLPFVDLGTNLKAKMVRGSISSTWSIYHGHVCALFDNGRVKCWGKNSDGQLGQGNTQHKGDNSGEMGDSLPYTDLGTNSVTNLNLNVKSIGLGYEHSCALFDDGKVKCWGKNNYGQLGLDHSNSMGDGSGEMGDNLPYVNLGAVAKEISLGHDHTCALLEGGLVKCWGRAHKGQLGQEDGNNRGDNANEMASLEPINLGDSIAKRISSGGDHNCVITKNNDLLCWGYNNDSALGINRDPNHVNIGDSANEMGNNLSVTHLVSEDAVYVELGTFSTCAMRKNKKLYCWGYNQVGELGLGHTQSKGNAATTPDDVNVDLGSSRTAKVMQINYRHGCALLDNDDVKCWGYNNHGQLGQGNTTGLGDNSGEMGDNLAAVDLLLNIVGLVWGGYASNSINYNESAPALTAPTGGPAGMTFVYTTTTSDVCTVDRTTGALTIGDAGTCTVVLTASLAGYRDEVRTFDVSINGLDMGSLTWNGYSSNSVTFPTAPTLSNPTGAPQGATFAYSSTTLDVCTVNSMMGALTLVDAGTCTISLTASATGYNDKTLTANITITPLDMGTLAWSGYPTSMVLAGPIIHPNSVTGTLPSGVSYSYSTTTSEICSVDRDDGGVWGLDLGTCNIAVTVHAPGYNDKILPGVSITSERGGVVVGGIFSCALLPDGQVKCWGGNTDGQLGQGHTNNLGDGPNEMGVNLASVNLGVGLRAKLLRGSIATRTSRTRYPGHVCVLFDNGRIKCWGRNTEGQLGHGNTQNKGDDPGEMGDNLPYTNLGTDDLSENLIAKSLGLGDRFGCVLFDDGRLKCWGKNDYGQLGLDHTNTMGDGSGEMGDDLPYVNLGVGREAKEIGLGENHICALLDNGTVKCWGRNHRGQLGQGDTNNRGDSANEMASLNGVNLGANRTAKRISTGREHSCVITKNNNLLCWGGNGSSELGVDRGPNNSNIGDALNEMGDNLMATHLVTQDAIYVNAGFWSTCVIRKTGTLYCWGSNGEGFLGLGVNGDDDGVNEIGGSSTTPDDVDVDLGTGRRAKIMKKGLYHSCALLDNNDIKCWGNNQHGELGQGNRRFIGSYPRQMGDHLAAVDLVPDILGIVWSGYSLDTIAYGENEPTLTEPTGEPSGTTFAYTTATPNVCSVDGTMGTLTIEDAGTCTVTLTASLTGHRDEVMTFDLTVNGLDMGSLAWSGYSGNNSATFPTAPTLSAPTGAPQGATFTYSSTTASVCTVSDETLGSLSLVNSGTCTIRLTASATGYSDKTIDQNITIAAGTMSNLSWDGYSRSVSSVSSPDLTPMALTGAPAGATLSYSTNDSNICTVNESTGSLDVRGIGTCVVTLNVSANGYTSEDLQATLTITQ